MVWNLFLSKANLARFLVGAGFYNAVHNGFHNELVDAGDEAGCRHIIEEEMRIPRRTGVGVGRRKHEVVFVDLVLWKIVLEFL